MTGQRDMVVIHGPRNILCKTRIPAICQKLHDIYNVRLPSHTSDWVQPLDVRVPMNWGADAMTVGTGISWERYRTFDPGNVLEVSPGRLRGSNELQDHSSWLRAGWSVVSERDVICPNHP